jgi:hypothetical protein
LRTGTEGLMGRLMEERIARNEATFREANEKIGETAERLEVNIPVPFMCECAEPSCTAIIRLPLEEYEEIRAHPRHFLNAPGHEAAARGFAEVVEERGNYSIAEKTGYAGEVAEALDERTGPAGEELTAGH